MAEEGRGVSLAILGIVAVIAVVGLVLLFKGGTGGFVQGYGSPKIYPGHVVQGDTGPGFQYEGEGAYVTEQKGTCLSNEVFIFGREQDYDPNQCRPGEMRIEVYQRSRKFFGAPDQTYSVDGVCCPQPYTSYPELEE